MLKITNFDKSFRYNDTQLLTHIENKIGNIWVVIQDYNITVIILIKLYFIRNVPFEILNIYLQINKKEQ